MNHNNNFHFVRLMAALLVIITHAYQHTGNYFVEPLVVWSGDTFSISTIGLYMFFFTSGFLVTKSARESENTIHFLFKRFLRIYPALIVLVLLSVFVAGPLLTRLSTADYYRHPDTWKYLRNILGVGTKIYLPGVFEKPTFHVTGFNGPLWSVSLELKLYISLALLMALKLINKKRVHLLICAGVLLTIYLVWLLDHFSYVHIRKGTEVALRMIMVFYLGGLVQTARPGEKLLGITCTAAGIFFILRHSVGIELLPAADEILFFSLITYFIAHTKKFTVRLTNDISYGMYLFSAPIQQICFIISGYNTSPWVNILLTLVPLTGIAWMSWKCIEKPSLQLKPYYRRLTVAWNARP